MTEVYSTSVAMVFDKKSDKNRNKKSDMPKRKESNKISSDKKGNDRPKMSKEKIEDIIQRKIEYAMNNFGGRYVEFENGNGMLVAALERKGKKYFLYIDKDRKTQISDTKDFVCGLYDVPTDMTIVDYLLRTDYDYIKGIIDEFFKFEDSAPAAERYNAITKIKIGRNNNDKSGKRNDRNDKNRKKNKKNFNKKEDNA